MKKPMARLKVVGGFDLTFMFGIRTPFKTKTHTTGAVCRRAYVSSYVNEHAFIISLRVAFFYSFMVDEMPSHKSCV
jgi:hypothetical protein